MLGAFVSGMFEGAKSTFELMEMRNKMEVQNRKMQEGRDAEALLKKDAEYDKINASPTMSGGSDAPAATTGTSTQPAPAVTPTPVVREVKQSSNPGDPELWEQIKPYIQKYEGANNYKTGYGLGDKGDITKYPAKPGYFGFPDWPGATAPNGTQTHAGGMYQFQPETWKYYAEREGVNDFSPESQDRVARRAYVEDGLKHWIGIDPNTGKAFNETLRAELSKAGLLGGLATRAARSGQARPPTVAGREPDADLGGGRTAPAPDLEGQRAAAKPVLSPAVVDQIVKPVVSALTSNPQSMPDGSAQMVTPPPVGPTPNPLAPTRQIGTPADTAAAQSALTPAPAPAVAAAPVVAPPSPRSGMSQRQQYDAAIAAGERPAFPPDQKWNSRGEAVSQDIGRPLLGQRVTSPSGAVNRGFAQANKIIRLPDGTMVDGSGSVVQGPQQSALFPTR